MQVIAREKYIDLKIQINGISLSCKGHAMLVALLL
jgi:hypothetical protein